jgi:hypothetical protein
MVVLAAVMVMAVGKVAEADAHVVTDGAGDGESYRDAKDGVGDGQGIEVTVAEEEEAGGESPEGGDGGEDGVGQVGEREEGGCREGGGEGVGKQAEETQEEEVLQEELLHAGPDGIADVEFDELQGAIWYVQGVEAGRDEDGDEGEQERCGDDPERTQPGGDAEAHRLGAVEGNNSGKDDPGDGGEIEGALPGSGRPDDDQDEDVADGEFSEDAGPGVWDGWIVRAGDRG